MHGADPTEPTDARERAAPERPGPTTTLATSAAGTSAPATPERARPTGGRDDRPAARRARRAARLHPRPHRPGRRQAGVQRDAVPAAGLGGPGHRRGRRGDQPLSRQRRRSALTAKLADRFGVDPGQIAVGCGSVALCQQLVEATCVPGDEVLYPWRSFEAYPIITAVVGATSVQVPLRDEALDLAALADAITDRTRLIFVCSPEQPDRDRRRPGRAGRLPGPGPGPGAGRARRGLPRVRRRPRHRGRHHLRPWPGQRPGAADPLQGVRPRRPPGRVRGRRPRHRRHPAQGRHPVRGQRPRPGGGHRLARRREGTARTAAGRSSTSATRVRDALLSAGFAVPRDPGQLRLAAAARSAPAEFAAHCEQAEVIVRPFNHPPTTAASGCRSARRSRTTPSWPPPAASR